MSLPTSLPPEILEHVLSYLPPSSQGTFHAAALVSRAWYSTAIKYLYHSPILTGKNFDPFVRSVCPSINAHIRHNGLADLIQRLDMSGLVHNGSRSLTARLLGRVKHNLDEFIAPQASFGVNSLAAISKCNRLRCLDLGFVSEAIPMSDLLRSIRGLDKLVLLYLPRAFAYVASKEQTTNQCTTWPASLREVHLNGGFKIDNQSSLKSLPPSVTDLWIENCPRPASDFLRLFFDAKGSQLESLHVTLLTRRYFHSMIIFDIIAQSCGNLRSLSVNIELFENSWGVDVALGTAFSFPCVERLDLKCLIEHDDEYLDRCLNFISGFLFSEKVPKLRKLLVDRKLRWTGSEVRSRQTAEMNELLKALAREDGERAEIPEDQAGVVFFGQR